MVEGFYLKLYRVFDGCFESILEVTQIEREKTLYNYLSALGAPDFYSGDHGEEETPVPIPNTAVKLFSGGGSWSAGSREISTLPG